MNAAFTTEGKTTMQSALSSKFCGMLSGTSRISFKTVPQFFNRSSSFVWSEALATSARSGNTTSRILLRQGNNFRMGFPFSRFTFLRPRGGNPDATSERDQKFEKVVENRSAYSRRKERKRRG